MKVLFVSINKLKSFRPVLPIGMVTIATQARAAGHQVRTLDLMWEEDDEPVVRAAVRDFRPDVVGISIRNVDSQNMLEPVVYTPLAREVADWSRDELPGVTVLLGGPGFSTVPEDLMDFVRADYGVTGFAEESVQPLLEQLARGRRPQDVPGVIYPDGQGGYHRREAVFRIDYRKAARPDPALYDQRYFDYSYETHDRSLKVPATIQTKKGCVLECVFCSNFLVDGTGVKFDEVSRVADEVERLRDEGLEVLEIVDGVFNLPLNYALEVLREFVRRGIRMPWSCMVNPGNVTAELVDLMARTGCYYVEFGTDSACDRILRGLKKNFRQRQIVESHRRFVEAGIRVEHCLFIGSPGDDRDSVRETFEVMGQLVPPAAPDVHAFWTLGLRVCRGTALHATAVAEGMITGTERFIVPKYYASRAVMTDDALLDEIQARVLANDNWYLWWGLSSIGLRERIAMARAESERIEAELNDHLPPRRPLPLAGGPRPAGGTR
ncbi:B12-binding domain-containing radical SAM protein [Kitasatospora aureofaciens]|uniref:B12-binding domain-containing radical SAM protein n=1 Tax=Kitasatospora aureofaciens TaxID=1894 RepID=UPI0027DECEF4|nr:cobalamin-dependent protein [Kitasatospora aureofaciens]